MKISNQKGFTIVELLIVIVVIAILAAISIVAFTGIQQRGRDSQRASDVSNIVKALTAYTTDGNAWPTEAGTSNTTGARGALSGYTTANLSSDIIGKIHADAPDATNNNRYQYTPCGTTGATITYWKESAAGTTADPNLTSVTAGIC